MNRWIFNDNRFPSCFQCSVGFFGDEMVTGTGSFRLGIGEDFWTSGQGRLRFAMIGSVVDSLDQ